MNAIHAKWIILLFILIRPSLGEIANDNGVDDYVGENYEEDDYDYDLNEILNETEPPTTSSTTTPAPTTRFSSRTKATTQRIPKLLGGTFQDTPNYVCPEECNCNFDFTYINCSMRNLEHVPYALPHVVEKLDLSSNVIKKLEQGDFSSCRNLKELILDNNPLGTVDFTQIDIKVFEPMKDLVKLKLPELEENTIRELCKLLTSIDIISFPKFDISCFELESDSSFDDSIIPRQSSEGDDNGMPSTDDKDGLKSFASRDNSSNADNKNGEKSIKSEQESVPKRRRPPSAMEPTQRNRTLSDSLSNGTTPAINQQTDDSGDEEEYKVAISSQTINHILIGIIIVAVAGIIIGIICRRDICGVKTKMCRTRRPPPTDQVRPAEEIPLNKV
ncbi:uncharacterized protein LOC119649872 isoform X2 [Hermetia illucens]|uniref:uncharacterized protein LOC119649872 isoform X2 n=1 Tax=Hermetia illucens TaxID=343691 RepID=UPI0018CC3417|nr:uncharacterized protein LOC119649872 isoform X2 [Hermetia illucens]